MADQVYDGKPMRIPHRFRLRCCDCGLTHAFHIRPLSNGLRLIVTRQIAATKRTRKLKKYQHVKNVAWKRG